MKLIEECRQDDVWRHWKKMEGFPERSTYRWRMDVRGPLPGNMKWFLAEVEENDIAKIYIISSDDWRPLTWSFTLLDAVDALDKNIHDWKIGNILEKKRIYRDNIDGLDRKFILVSPSLEGNFTVIEGNKRSVALQSLNRLVSNQIYLGVSSEIRNYWWARYSADGSGTS